MNWNKGMGTRLCKASHVPSWSMVFSSVYPSMCHGTLYKKKKKKEEAGGWRLYCYYYKEKENGDERGGSKGRRRHQKKGEKKKESARLPALPGRALVVAVV